MTELNFKGKEFVYNHHLAVPFRPLEPIAAKGIGPVDLGGNLIIQGDNLHALKALLPMYAGKVDCIFIDPPYNTGNEGWAYNDNVNAPMIKAWLESNPIGIEDGLRHDKWCAMMWPRLRLLHELLADDGVIFVSIDDNEQANLRSAMEEIFGEQNFVSNIIWEKRYSPQNAVKWFSESHDFVVVYAKNKVKWYPNLLERSDEMNARYRNLDNDPRGVWKPADATAQAGHGTKSQFYELIAPNGKKHALPNGRCWVYTQPVFEQMIADNRVWFGESGNNVPAIKRFLSEVKQGTASQTIWKYNDVGHNQDAKKEINELFPESSAFDTPKPSSLIGRILQLATDENSLILDSFAGSGTTAHAVLEANRRDGGNRKFILVEMEDYADRLTAERVRRVINGYDFQGTQKTELLRESLNWRTLTKAADLVHRVDGIENLHAHEYDAIKKTVKDGELIVTGEKTVAERTEGLSGSFTYCTLGAAIDLDAILTGDALPSFANLGAALFHMATNRAFEPSGMEEASFYLGATESQHVWLIYKPDLEWLKSPDAALTLSRAKAFAAAKEDGKKHLVFAPARYVSQKLLAEQNIPVEFVPLPFALYRMEQV